MINIISDNKLLCFFISYLTISGIFIGILLSLSYIFDDDNFNAIYYNTKNIHSFRDIYPITESKYDNNAFDFVILKFAIPLILLLLIGEVFAIIGIFELYWKVKK